MQAEIELEPLCEDCGYNLTGLDSGRCPECGGEFNPAAPFVSRIAWTRRRKIGYLTAYLRTAALPILNPKLFVKERMQSNRALSGHASSFQSLTFCLASISVASSLTFLFMRLGRDLHPAALIFVFPVFCVLFWGYFMIAANIAGDLYASPDKLNEPPHAKTMLRYACGPLGFAPIAAVVFCGVVLLLEDPLSYRGMGEVLETMAWLVGLFAFLWWLGLFRLIHAMKSLDGASVLQLFVLLPVLWAIIGGFWAFAAMLLMMTFAPN